MIPVLYPHDEKGFLNRGLGPLPDAISCYITEERNGVYELELEYPVGGLHFNELTTGTIIKARNAYLGEQAFDVYMISRPMGGVVTVNARHISYRLNHLVVEPCYGATVGASLRAIKSHIMDNDDFEFWTDRETEALWSTDVPQNVRSVLGGSEGSILDVYNAGEYEWDNFKVKFWGHRGNDTGVSICYGKNLLDVTAEEDSGDVYTACVPYYKAQDGTVVYGSKVTTDAWSESEDLTCVMDMSEYFQPAEDAEDNWTPSVKQLEAKALNLMEQNAVWRASQNLKVEFALLSQSKEYEYLSALERINLCDYVTVTHRKMGINVKVKCIKTVWDVLHDRYQSIELGEPRASLSSTLTKDLSDTFKDIKDSLNGVVTQTRMSAAIEKATNLLTGGAGGHVVISRNANGEPNEILVMNTESVDTATSVIRINANGIGFSKNGINGPYKTAWTIDGHFVADFIDSGSMSAERVDVSDLAAFEATIGGFNIKRATNHGTTAEGGHFFENGLFAQSSDGQAFEYEIGLQKSNWPLNLAFYVGRIPLGAKWSDSNKEDLFFIRNNGELYAQEATVKSLKTTGTLINQVSSYGLDDHIQIFKFDHLVFFQAAYISLGDLVKFGGDLNNLLGAECRPLRDTEIPCKVRMPRKAEFTCDSSSALSLDNAYVTSLSTGKEWHLTGTSRYDSAAGKTYRDVHTTQLYMKPAQVAKGIVLVHTTSQNSGSQVQVRYDECNGAIRIDADGKLHLLIEDVEVPYSIAEQMNSITENCYDESKFVKSSSYPNDLLFAVDETRWTSPVWAHENAAFYAFTWKSTSYQYSREQAVDPSPAITENVVKKFNSAFIQINGFWVTDD